MISIALKTLRRVCAEVAISGNRDDLGAWARVVREARVEAGPAAGIEAALAATACEWVLMLPVDLPLIPAELLHRWMDQVLAQDGVRASYLECDGNWHPALCLVHQECLEIFRQGLERGDRKLKRIFSLFGDRLLVLDAATLWPNAERYFANVNTPEELATAERMQY